MEPEKICSDCNVVKKISQFNWKERKKGTRQPRCKSCQSVVQAIYYKKKRKQYIGRIRANQKKKLFDYTEWKKTVQCCICTESFITCLDLHHVDAKSKDYNISELLTHSRSRVFEELKKCVIVCSNCHRKIHGGVLCVTATQLEHNHEMIERFKTMVIDGPVI